MKHPYRESTVINPNPAPRRNRWASASARARARLVALPPWARALVALVACMVGMGLIVDVWAITWPIHGVLSAVFVMLGLCAAGIVRALHRMFR